MNYFPHLITQRLVLTKLKIEYLNSLVKLCKNKKVASQIVNMPYPFTEINASLRLGYVTKGFEEKSHYCFAITNKETDELIGEVSLHERNKKEGLAELGYWVGELHWNKGYASEAVAAILAFGKEQIHYKTIFATCVKQNLASQSVLVKNGMELSETKGNHLIFVLK